MWNDEFLGDVADILRRKETLTVQHPIVFLGSSSFRLWQTLAEDLGRLDVFNAGFGGGTFEGGIQHAERVLSGMNPSKIFVYFGENDIASNGLTADQTLESWARLDQKLDAIVPRTPVTYLSSKCGPARWIWRPNILEYNEKLSIACRSAGRGYLDVDAPLIGMNGKPKQALFEADSIHINRDGYRIWSECIYPELLTGA